MANFDLVQQIGFRIDFEIVNSIVRFVLHTSVNGELQSNVSSTDWNEPLNKRLKQNVTKIKYTSRFIVYFSLVLIMINKNVLVIYFENHD